MENDLAKILIVDDQPKNLISMQAILDSLNQTIVTASSGQQALKLVLDHQFAVILMDVQMPNMDGFETATIIRNRDRCRHVPIIFLTAYGRDSDSVLRGYALGAVDFVFKPIEVDEIIRSKVSVFVQLHNARHQERELEHEQRHVRELQVALEQYRSMGQASGLTVGKSMYGTKPLCEAAKEAFGELVDRYGRVLAVALESRAVKIEHDVPQQLRELAHDLGFLRAGPRDVVEVHTQALAIGTLNATPAKAQALVAEGRFRVLELMGNLVTYYRKYYTGGAPMHAAPTTQTSTTKQSLREV